MENIVRKTYEREQTSTGTRANASPINEIF
jgi:hypothetical protein